jgi:hypothetical protein
MLILEQGITPYVRTGAIDSTMNAESIVRKKDKVEVR